MKPAGLLILTHSTDPTQEHCVIFIIPQVGLPDKLEDVAIRLYSIVAEHRNIEISEEFVVVGNQCGITDHQRDFFERAVIVALEVAAICAGTRVCTDVYRSGGTFGTRHTNHYDILPFETLKSHHAVGKNIAADLLTAVDGVPEIF